MFSTVGSCRTAWLLLLGASTLLGCGALDVSDPTAIEESELNDAAGAELLRGAALNRLYFAFGEDAVAAGLVADEFLATTPLFYQQYGVTNSDEVLDRRATARYAQLLNASGVANYADNWHSARHAATVAMSKLRAYEPDGVHFGEMLAVRGFTTLQLAEHFCPGFPLDELVNNKPVYGPPLSTDQALESALADFDSAVVYAADSARVLDFARIGRGRALLALGRFAEAGAAVSAVATGYVSLAEFSATSAPYMPNPLAVFAATGLGRSVADQEGHVGLDFVSANDPRLPLVSLGIADDSVTPMYRMAQFANRGSPIVMASGIEARLIEAEANLHEGGAWLPILNALRANVSPAMAALADPGAADARVDLLFRERAFWLFGTGRRLGDLRRLTRHYERAADAVFPYGAYHVSGTYDVGTTVPFSTAIEKLFNPAVTGCTSL